MSQSKNISKITGKTEQYVANGIKLGSSSVVSISSTPAASSLTATATTVTAVQVLSGILTQSPSSALTVTLPSAATFVAAIPGCAIGDTFRFAYINLNGTNAATIAVDGSTGTLVGGSGVALSTSAEFVFRLTGVTGSGSYVVYRM